MVVLNGNTKFGKYDPWESPFSMELHWTRRQLCYSYFLVYNDIILVTVAALTQFVNPILVLCLTSCY